MSWRVGYYPSTGIWYHWTNGKYWNGSDGYLFGLYFGTFYFSIYILNSNPSWLIFSDGLRPPTSSCNDNNETWYHQNCMVPSWTWPNTKCYLGQWGNLVLGKGLSGPNKTWRQTVWEQNGKHESPNPELVATRPHVQVLFPFLRPFL